MFNYYYICVKCDNEKDGEQRKRITPEGMHHSDSIASIIIGYDPLPSSSHSNEGIVIDLKYLL